MEYSDWALLAGPAQGPGSDGGPPRFFAVPRSDYTYEDTWHTLGMRGTGSHDIVIDDAFVPDHRTCLREDAMQGRTAEGDRRYAPTLAVNGLTFVTPALGAALGALDAALPLLKGPAAGPRAAYTRRTRSPTPAPRDGSTRHVSFWTGSPKPQTQAGSPRTRAAEQARLRPRPEMLTSAVDALARTGGTADRPTATLAEVLGATSGPCPDTRSCSSNRPVCLHAEPSCRRLTPLFQHGAAAPQQQHAGRAAPLTVR